MAPPNPFEDPAAEILALAKSSAGIDLGRPTHIEGCLAGRMRQLACDLRRYAAILHEDRTELLVCIGLLTAPHVSWLSVPEHFADLEHRILPAFVDTGQIRIWCSSTGAGEEPYSVALCLARSLPAPVLRRASILATDISTRAMDRASEAVYSEEQVAALGTADRRLALDAVEPGRWRVKSRLRHMVQLAHVHLLDEDWPMRGPFDVIFCRNVLRYFDDQASESLLRRMADLLVPGGTLYVDSGDGLDGLDHGLSQISSAIYLRP